MHIFRNNTTIRRTPFPCHYYYMLPTSLDSSVRTKSEDDPTTTYDVDLGSLWWIKLRKDVRFSCLATRARKIHQILDRFRVDLSSLGVQRSQFQSTCILRLTKDPLEASISGVVR